MTKRDYFNLKNGSDIRGIATEGVEGQFVNLTEEAVENIAKSFCVWLISHTGKTTVRVAVGYDSRISSPALCEAAVRGITSTGHHALVTGLSTTPSMFMLLQNKNMQEENPCHGSIMITASHLPSNRNGMKFFFHNGGLESVHIDEILTWAPGYRFAEPGTPGNREEMSYLETYANDLVQIVRDATGEETPLAGKKIIVDAGNGAGGFYAHKVLAPLGANTAGSQFLDPDGTFPNHIPNPENKEAMQSVCNAVKATKADFGIIFDTDVDRAGAVDCDGTEINRNRLIALIAAILLEEKPGTIVTDSVTSNGLTKFITQRGGRHHRFKRGYKNVINEAIRLNNKGEYTPLAIETSGHAALKENYFLDDGAFLMTRILIALAKCSKEGKKLTDLIADLEMPKEEKEVRLRFVDGCDFKKMGAKILKDYEQHVKDMHYIEAAPDNYEGCRANYDWKHGDGWTLVRMSLHEPILPINMESDSFFGVLKMLKDLYYFLKDYSCLDVTPLREAIESERERLINLIKTRYRANPQWLYFLFY
ncbi:MAG: phosphomannomutase/phosphoglucomutase [Clostridia bacterium]|nr:phosphomannomutase/phosphoglucomutase [Clostridia bacterium]